MYTHTCAYVHGTHACCMMMHDKAKIMVLISTSTLAWGVNFPAHLVIVKGTEYYDGSLKRCSSQTATLTRKRLEKMLRSAFGTLFFSVFSTAIASLEAPLLESAGSALVEGSRQRPIPLTRGQTSGVARYVKNKPYINAHKQQLNN